MEPLTNRAECNSEGGSRKWMNHEEMVQYLENWKIKIENCQRENRAFWDKQFFELRLDIFVAFELLRRRTAKLERRIPASARRSLGDGEPGVAPPASASQIFFKPDLTVSHRRVSN